MPEQSSRQPTDTAPQLMRPARSLVACFIVDQAFSLSWASLCRAVPSPAPYSSESRDPDRISHRRRTRANRVELAARGPPRGGYARPDPQHRLAAHGGGRCRHALRCRRRHRLRQGRDQDRSRRRCRACTRRGRAHGHLRACPVGMPTKRDRRQGSHASRQDSETLRAWIDTRAGEPNAKEIRERADRQLGTLGSGNPYRLALIRQAALRQASRDRAGVVRALPHAAARQGAGVPRLRRGRRSRVLRGHAVRNALRRGITRAHRDRLSRPTCSARSP